MSRLKRNFIYRLRRAFTFRRAVRLLDALRLILSDHRDGHCHVRLHTPPREILVRRNTSDSECLEKVFIHKEYKIPFDIAPRIIVDAGANTGMATLYFSSQYPKAKIFSIEPDPSNFEVLEKNCAHLPNVTLIKGALWPTQSELTVHTSELGKWASWVSEGIPTGGSMQAIKAVTVPEIIQNAGSEYIDLLKLDIEGSEKDLFSRGTEDWLGKVGCLTIELHDRYRPGCAHSFYSAITKRYFLQENRGENIFVRFDK